MEGIVDAGQVESGGKKTKWSGVVDIDDNPDDKYSLDKKTGNLVVPNDNAGGSIGKRNMLYPETEVGVYSDDGGKIQLDKSGKFPALFRDGVEPQVQLPPPTVKGKKKGKAKAAQVEPESPSIVVAVTGPWGRIATECSGTAREGVTLALIGCAWTPPSTDDVLTVEFEGRAIKAYSPGIAFDLPNGMGRVVVLLVEE